MSKIVGRKWKLASGLGFAFALAFDLIGKVIAANHMMSIAMRTAGLPPIEPRGWLATQFSPVSFDTLGLCFAVLAAVCWGVSAYRSEPGSSFLLAVLVVLYSISFCIMV